MLAKDMSKESEQEKNLSLLHRSFWKIMREMFFLIWNLVGCVAKMLKTCNQLAHQLSVLMTTSIVINREIYLQIDRNSWSKVIWFLDKGISAYFKRDYGRIPYKILDVFLIQTEPMKKQQAIQGNISFMWLKEYLYRCPYVFFIRYIDCLSSVVNLDPKNIHFTQCILWFLASGDSQELFLFECGDPIFPCFGSITELQSL